MPVLFAYLFAIGLLLVGSSFGFDRLLPSSIAQTHVPAVAMSPARSKDRLHSLVLHKRRTAVMKDRKLADSGAQGVRRAGE